LKVKLIKELRSLLNFILLLKILKLILNFQMSNYKRMYNNFVFVLLLLLTMLFHSCANQLPPSGGKDDKSSPEILTITPKPGTVNYKKNIISISFNKYVDKRSFEESFYISPTPKGSVNFDWSGTNVEIKYPESFDINRTYIIAIGKNFKDIYNNNFPGKTFAFSTGTRLDNGIIKGKIYSDNLAKIKVLAFMLNEINSENLNPADKAPDYITFPDESGNYTFTNLSEGTFRLFALTDDDRNNLFNKDFEIISVLNNDLYLKGDSSVTNNANFFLKNTGLLKTGKDFLKELNSDSTNFIFSNIATGTEFFPDDYKFYLYFKNNNLTKSEIVNNLSVTDTITKEAYKLVYNWLNDSLLEIFSIEKFKHASVINFLVNLKDTKKNIVYSMNMKIAGNKNFGIISGRIKSVELPGSPVYIMLFSKDNKFITYRKKLLDTNDFRFDDILEGSYSVFAFIDNNGNGVFDGGSYFKFVPSEIFSVYEKDIKVKGNWNTDNVFIEF